MKGYKLTQTGVQVQEILDAVNNKADRSEAVSDISYNSASKNIEKTVDGTTTAVVSATTIVTAGGEGKQDKLVSGTNIKTINNQSLLGPGNLNIAGIDHETDPTVPAWAKRPNKPSYTASEIGAVPITRTVNGKALSSNISLTASDVGAGTYSKPSGGIPTSDLASGVIPDVSQFITKSVNDLVNYYTKSQTYTQTEVQQLINAVKQFTYELVNTLPTASAATMNKIYLTPSSDPQTQNLKDEYITIQNGSTYSWEQIGSTAIDLSGYVTTTALNTALADYTTSADLATLLAGYQTKIDTTHKLDYSLLDNAPTKVSDFTNDSGFITTESDPTVPSWAKQSTKPSYTASEVGALPATTVIPDDLADLNDDATHRLVTDTQISTWNNKSDFSGNYNDLTNKPTIPAAQVNSDWNASSGVAQILNKPTIPTALSQLTDDSTHRVVTDTEKNTWNGKQAALVSGTNIKTVNNNSLLGSGDISISGGDVNIIEGIKMNNTALTPNANKVVDLGTVITAHQDISGKADKSEMSVSTSGDQTTITLKSGTSATVINSHQSLSGKQDTLVSGTNIKTINDNSVLGSGNLSTFTPIVNHGTSDTTFSVTPNILHIWGTVTSLTLTLATPTDNTIVNEYMIQFTSGSTATTLSLPSSVEWAESCGALSVEVNKTYQISIVNNIGLWAAISNS